MGRSANRPNFKLFPVESTHVGKLISMKEIKITVSLKIDIISFFCGLTFTLCNHSKKLNKTNSISYMSNQSQVIGRICLSKFQEVFQSMFEWPYLQRLLINRIGQKLVWLSFSIDLYEYPITKKSEEVMSIWHGMTL